MKKRFLSALIMILIGCPILLKGGKYFYIFMLLLSILSLYEILNIRESKKEFPTIMKLFAYLMVIFFSISNYDSISFSYSVDYRVMSLIIFIFLTPMVFFNDTKKYNINDALFLVGSTLFIGLSFNLLMIIRNYNLFYIIYMLLVTTMTDSFAYITGSLIGKNKLCPLISPKKTVEGLIGGVIMGVISASYLYVTIINPNYPLVLLIFITTILSLVGQVGDLAFSCIKRYYGRKDFSNLIPGHGGLLDRFDSLIFVALAMILFLGII